MNTDERRFDLLTERVLAQSLTSPTRWAPDSSRKSTNGLCSQNSGFVALIAPPSYDGRLMPPGALTKEHVRMEECRQRRAHWNRWGPFLSERAWGPVAKITAAMAPPGSI